MNPSKTPIVLQQERTECGLACLTMIMNYYGDKRTISDFRLQSAQRGVTLKNLIDIAEKNNLESQPLRIKLEEIKYLNLPAILHWEGKHFVVLTKVGANKAYINDPAVGRRVYSFDEVSEKFTGVALELSPTDSFKPELNKKQINWKSLLGDFSGLFGSLYKIFFIAIILEFLLLITPFYMQIIIDDVLTGEDKDLLNILLVTFIFVLLLQSLMTFLRSWTTKTLIVKLGLKWEKRIFTKLLKLPLGYFDQRTLGEVLSRFASVHAIKSFLGGSLVEVLMDGIMSVFVLFVLLMYSKTLTIISLISLTIYYLLRVSFFPIIRRHIESEYTAKAKQDSHTVETIRGTQTLKLFAGEKNRLFWWHNYIVDALNEGLKLAYYSINFSVIKNLLIGIERLVVIWFAAHLVLDNEFSVGMLVAYIAYRDIFANKISLLVDRYMEFKLLKVHAQRLQDITDAQPEREDGNEITDEIFNIKVTDLSYRYSDNEPLVLNKINLSINKGDSIVIVGSSGCGKTTLIKILTGLLEYASGEIWINDINMNQLNLKSFRVLCGTVMQDDQLFAGTIAQNIAFFNNEVDIDQVQHCAKLASIHEDIEKMPMKYNTSVGDMGSAFSGGQKQRIILARALYKDPEILILDEATSHLDIKNEKNINKSLSKLSKIFITIAHRRETISYADKVIVMNNGKVIKTCLPTEYLNEI